MNWDGGLAGDALASYRVISYDLSTPFDTSTISNVAPTSSTSFDIGTSNSMRDVTISSDGKKSFSFRQTIQLVGRLTPKLTATLKGSYNFQKSNRDNYYPLNTTRGRNTNGQASQSVLENSKTYAEINFRYRNKWYRIPG